MSDYRDPLKAGLLGLALPRAGHVYAGQPSRGLTFFLGVAAGLFLFIGPGVVIWLASAGDAVLTVRRRNSGAIPLDLPVETSPVELVPVSISGGPPAMFRGPAAFPPRGGTRPTAP